MNISRAFLLVAALTVLCMPTSGTAAPLPASSAPGTVLAIAATARWELGLVLDGRRTGDRGVIVMAVSPGSAAERMGVQVGDRLLAVNGRALAGASSPNALVAQTLADGDGDARLQVERDRRTLELSGRADDALAAAQARTGGATGCGYVSEIGVHPRVSRNIFPAEITMINGRSTPLSQQNRHQVPAGRQVLVVREFIDRHRLQGNELLRMDRMKRLRGARAYKTLVVDVEPGMRYSIGAELLPDRLDPDSIRANAYWQPVVWESRPEACR